MPVEEYPQCLTPTAFSVDAVEQWIQERWEGSCSKFYFGTRLKFLEKISATLQPYSTKEPDAMWNNPISMENVTLFKCFPNAFKEPADVESCLQRAARLLRPIWPDRRLADLFQPPPPCHDQSSEIWTLCAHSRGLSHRPERAGRNFFTLQGGPGTTLEGRFPKKALG
jgi:hypothetical protein